MNTKIIFTTTLKSLLVVILFSIFTGCNVIKADLLLPQLLVLRKALATVGLATEPNTGAGNPNTPTNPNTPVVTTDAPTFSPAAGTYTSAQSVTISTTTTGAILCYTTDGSTPSCDSSPTCTSGTLYSSPVSIATTTTLKALACKAGNQYSAVGTGIYTLTGAVDLPVISNLRDRGIVNTGFMIGTAGTNTSSVEVSLDNGSYSPATGTTSWKFQFPTGSSTWRDNSQHTVLVRTKNSVGNNSSVVSIIVRKGVNRDVNGDGYVDLAVGASSYGASQGRTYIFLSQGQIGITQSLAASANTIITGEAGASGFGIANVIGDFNGDGFADLAVGGSAYSTNTGRVYIFHSTGTAGITNIVAASANKIITGEATNYSFGMSLATGDVNGDGYSDLSVGSMQYNANQGKGYVFLSSGLAGISISAAGSASTIIIGEAGTAGIGVATAIGDINGDGYADVIFGASAYTTNTGRVYIFHSSSSGVASMGALAANTILTGESAGNNFGIPIASADVNGDGFFDLAIGAGNYNTNQGRVYVFTSSGISGIFTGNASGANTIITSEGANNILGTSLNLGDVNADGYSDLVIQGNNGGTTKGYIVLSAGATGIPSINASMANTIILNIETFSNNWGKFCTVADFNGDGYPDVVFGSMYAVTSTGKVRIFHSTPGSLGITATDATNANTTITGEATSNGFGVSVSN